MSSKVLVSLTLIACLIGCAAHPDQFAWEPYAKFDSKEIDESSGIVKSRQFEDVYWTHNDSGDRARIFAITAKGELIREVNVLGAENVDWEDLTIDNSGLLYIADTGNNANKRKDLAIYVVPEPNPFESDQVSVLKRVPFSYPDQEAFPDPDNRNFDCEAIAWSEGILYGWTKHRSDRRTKLYRFGPLEHEVAQTLTKISEFEIDGAVTGADITPDGRKLLLLCYEYIYLFEKPVDSDDFLAGRRKRILFEGRQSEGICFTGSANEFVITNEQQEIYRLPESIFDLRSSFIPELPMVSVPTLGEYTLDGRANEWAGVSGGLLKLSLNEIGHKKSITCASPTVRIGRVNQGLLLHIEKWQPAKTKKKKKVDLLQIMLGSRGERTVSLQPGAAVWRLRRSKKGKYSFKQDYPDQPSGFEPRLKVIEGKRHIATELFVPFPEVRGTGDHPGPILFNLILNPSSGCEWYWSTDSTTFSAANPYLWGEMNLGE